jgi:hypothetical protein
LLVLLGGVEEDVAEWETAFGVFAISITIDFIEKRSRDFLQPRSELLGFNRGDIARRIVVATLIKRLVDDDGRGDDIRSLSDCGIGDHTEEIVITMLVGGGREVGDWSVGGLGSVQNDNDLIRLDEFSVLVRSHLGNSGKRLPIEK